MLFTLLLLSYVIANGCTFTGPNNRIIANHVSIALIRAKLVLLQIVRMVFTLSKYMILFQVWALRWMGVDVGLNEEDFAEMWRRRRR
ncbi:hypothetical protein ACHAXT_001393 [Thalassiosira profunda]